MVARQNHRRDELAWLAWHTAALTRARKMPKLKDMLSTARTRPRERQSAEVQEAMIKAMFLAYGGDPEELKRLQ